MQTVTARSAQSSTPKTVGYVIGAVGIALHAWISFVKAEGGPSSFTLELWVLASLPYFIGLALLLRMRRTLIPLIGMLVALAVDVWLYYAVFVNPSSSTAAVALVAVPLWKLLVAFPIGLAIGWLIERWRWEQGAS